jgi:hypothetical protein
MPNYTALIKKEFRPRVQAFLDDLRNGRDKTFFKPTGTQMYTGEQGSGKTITAVRHCLQLKKRYPLALVVSNLDLKYFKSISFDQFKISGAKCTGSKREYIYFQSMAELERVLVGVNNGLHGVIYLIDEIHTYFNALDSKNIPMFVFTEISQQRKQRKVILATSQLFLRTAKPFREQCDNVIICRTFLGFITITFAFDGAKLSQDGVEDKKTRVRKMGWYFHTRLWRNAYDTFQKVVSGAEQYDMTQQVVVKQKK